MTAPRAEPGRGAGRLSGMRPLVLMPALGLALSLCLPAPASAQDRGGEPAEEGFGLMERGLGMLMEGLGDEMAPMLRQLRELAGELDRYEAPEMLPNGDIIIRRKAPFEPPVGDRDEVEL